MAGGKGEQGIVVGFYEVVVVFAHGHEALIHAILDKPDSSSVGVRHDGGPLHLEFLCGVVEVDRNYARISIKNEIELEQKSLFNANIV